MSERRDLERVEELYHAQSLRQRLAELKASTTGDLRAYQEAPIGLCYLDS